MIASMRKSSSSFAQLCIGRVYRVDHNNHYYRIPTTVVVHVQQSVRCALVCSYEDFRTKWLNLIHIDTMEGHGHRSKLNATRGKMLLKCSRRNFEWVFKSIIHAIRKYRSVRNLQWRIDGHLRMDLALEIHKKMLAKKLTGSCSKVTLNT